MATMMNPPMGTALATTDTAPASSALALASRLAVDIAITVVTTITAATVVTASPL